jgi:hypothetical protein
VLALTFIPKYQASGQKREKATQEDGDSTCRTVGAFPPIRIQPSNSTVLTTLIKIHHSYAHQDDSGERKSA